MLEISFTTIVTFLAKLLALSGWAAFSGMLILWPINDQPTSGGQWVFWWVQLVIVASFIFGIIKLI